jgi:hypothetical protein
VRFCAATAPSGKFNPAFVALNSSSMFLPLAVHEQAAQSSKVPAALSISVKVPSASIRDGLSRERSDTSRAGAVVDPANCCG